MDRPLPSATVRYGWAGLAATREGNMGRRLVANYMLGAHDATMI